MTSKRKFYKTTIKVEVLSEDPFDYDDLEEVHREIYEGGCVGDYETVKVEEIDGKQAAQELTGMGSEPGFFMLDDEGNDTEELEDDDEE